MQILAIALLLTSTAPSGSQTTARDLPSQIERANRAVKRTNGPEVCTTCGFPAGLDPAPGAWRECLREVCGAHVNEQNKEISRILSPHNMDPVISEFRGLVEDAFRSEMEVEVAVLRFAEKNLKAGTKISEPFAIQMGQLMNAVRNLKHLQLGANSEYDVQQTYDHFLAQGRTQQEAQLAMALAKASQDKNLVQPRLFSDHFDFVRQTMTPEEIQADINGAIKLIDDTDKRNAAKLGFGTEVFGASLTERQALRQKLASGNYGAAEIEKLQEHYSSQQIVEIMITNPELAKAATSIDAARIQPLKKAVVTAHLKAIGGYLKGQPGVAVTSLNLSSEAAMTTYNCLAPIALASAKLPTDGQIQRFVKHEEPTIRKKFLDKLKQYASAHSSSLINGQVGKALLRPPQSKQAFLRDMKNAITSLASENRRKIPDIERAMSSPARQTLYAILTAARSDLESNPEVAKELKDICKDNKPAVFNDQAYLFDGKFELSGETAVGGPDSHFTCHHEYGHLVSGTIQKHPQMSEGTKKWYEATRSCLQQGHAENAALTLEDDFADLLGFSFSGAGARTFCGFIPEEEQYLTLRNWNAEDPDHSGHLYRVLHSRVLNGAGIPENCKAALAEKGETPFERNCLKETPEGSVR